MFFFFLLNDEKQLSTTTSLIKFLKNVAELPIYSPAEGYRYFPKTTSKKDSKGLSQQQDPDSDMTTPGAEYSTQSNSQIPNSTSQGTTAAAAAASSSNNDSGLLFESFNLAQRYGTEYMDENPLQGEPGSFVFSSTNERLRARQHEQAVKAAAAAAAATAASSKTSESQTASAVSTPLSMTEVRMIGQKGNKTVKEQANSGGVTVPPPKPKRRKSRAPTSPVSPDGTDNKGIKSET